MDKQGHNPKIGLLGGSFNPAHEGHLEISLRALEFLELDFVWWLVSPGNPLKDETTIAPFEERLKSAKKIANDPRIIVSDMERNFETTYTVDTLERLIANLPSYHFVWLMGADNLVQFHQWKEWRRIAEIVPIAIFNRPSYSNASLESVAAIELKNYRIKDEDARLLHRLKPPAWVFYELTENPVSSTEIRSNNK